MPTYNVTLKTDVPKEELEKAKQTAIDQGGSIEHEFTIISGFTVKFPEDKVNVLTTNDKIHVEADGEMKTQQ